MISRVFRLLVASLAGLAITAGAALAAPGPTTAGGKRLQLLATGLNVTTAFAFGDGQLFAAAGGSEDATTSGGVFVVKHGRAQLLPGSPDHVFGITWHDGMLYISARRRLYAWGGFNGSQFTIRRTIYTAPPTFSNFNGIGFGTDGRLYVGVSVGEIDFGPVHSPWARDILSFTRNGRGPRVVARGMRQPWQMVFPNRSSSPYVTDLGQDRGATNPPDMILRIRPGQNYGFDACNWTVVALCKGYARPFRLLSAHTDPMGIGIIGKRLYFSEYGVVRPPKVVSMPLTGGRLRTEASGFPNQIVGLGTHDGWVYVGGQNGQIWRFRAG
jgi:glucose/arabinose dehydrogenase